MKYRDFLQILLENGFTLDRERATHHQYEGMVDGKRRLVTLDYASLGEDIQANNLSSMIRQSGLPKKTFR